MKMSRSVLRSFLGSGLLTASILSFAGIHPGVYGVETSDGVEYFRIRSSVSESGQKEWAYEHREERMLAPDTWSAVLHSRDLDGDQKPDGWFYRNESGLLLSEDRPASREDGWDVAADLIGRQIRVEDRWLASIALNAVFSQLSFTIGSLNQIEATILRDELNTESLNLIASRIQRARPNDPLVGVLREVTQRATNDLIDRLEGEESRRMYGSLAGDAALLFLTGGLGKGLVAAESWVVSRVGATRAATASAEFFSRYLGSMRARAASLAVRGGAAEALAHAEAQMLLRLAPAQAVRVSLQGLMAQSRLGRAAGTALSRVADVARAGASQWKYIALTQSLQVGAELVSRGRALYDPNPIVMAQKFTSNEEFIQNFLFMSNETFWMAGLSTYFSTPGKRIVACGLFSLLDSTVMNYAIKRTVDPERQALDTGWEVVVGNSQTQIDLAALRSVEATVRRTGNTRLRLLGYLVVIADQGAGYYGYSRASMAVETRVVPVVGE